MAKIIVLGAGLVGRAIALDLAREHEVTSADIHGKALASLARDSEVRTLELDVTNRKELGRAVTDFDLAIGAVPGFLGYRTLQTVIGSGVHVVDISFCPEDMLALDELAREKGVTAIVDMGVAPGMSNLILGYHDAHMKVESFECVVGGLPVRREWPFDYKAPFSPIDVIEEYTRPARYVEHGRQVTRPALSDPELLEFEEIGTLEAFNTDGLRSLLVTMPHVPYMKEKTLRYPGHVRLIEALRHAGFFGSDKIDMKGVSVRPIDFTSRILRDAWRLEPGDHEFTVMRVIVAGKENGTPVRYTYNLLDRYDRETGISSMARTTGYACTAAAQLLLDGRFKERGVLPPERVGRHAAGFEFIVDYLKARGVTYKIERDAMELHTA